MTTVWTMISDATGANFTQVCLAVTDSGSIVALPPPAKTTIDANGNPTPVDPVVYDKQLKQQQWIFNCLSKGSSVSVSSTNYIQSATFQIQSNYSQAYLNVDAKVANAIMSSNAVGWLCSLQSVGPSSFTYSANPWVIYTTSRDELIVPQMTNPGSEPLTWSITPALPQGLVLQTTGIDAGTIMIASGMTAVQSPAVIYTVTASIVINGQTHSSTAQVTIEVDVPASGMQT
jgi:hypothetical protein